MNTALIGHIMNQRLKKGEIWPSWWEGKVWLPGTWLPVLPIVGIPFLLVLPVPWIYLVADPAIVFGRALFLVTLGIMGIDTALLLGLIHHNLRQRLDDSNLLLTMLAHRSPRGAVLDWLFSDVFTLCLRMLRYVPFCAIAVAASGLMWLDCAHVVILAFAAAIAALTMLYAAAAALHRGNLAPALVGLVACLAFFGILDPFTFTFARLSAHIHSYTAYLVLVAVAATAIAMLGLELRVRRAYTRRWRWRWRWRVPVSRWLGHMPEATLLLRGVQGNLGMLGDTFVWPAMFILGLGVASIGWFGWSVILFCAMGAVGPIMRALWKSRALDDVGLAANTVEKLRRMVCGAVLIALSSVLPALVAALPLGRGTIKSYSIVTFARQLAETVPPAEAFALTAGLVATELVFSELVFVACILGAIESWTDDTTGSTPFAGSRKDVGLAALAFVALAAMNLATLATDIWFPAIVFLVSMSLVSLVAGVAIVLSWRNLRTSLPLLVGTTAEDFAHRPAQYVHL
jgi:hypothetical protein